MEGMTRDVKLLFAEGHCKRLHEQHVIVYDFYVADVAGDVGSDAPQRDDPKCHYTGAEDGVSEGSDVKASGRRRGFGQQ